MDQDFLIRSEFHAAAAAAGGFSLCPKARGVNQLDKTEGLGH